MTASVLTRTCDCADVRVFGHAKDCPSSPPVSEFDRLEPPRPMKYTPCPARIPGCRCLHGENSSEERAS